MRKLLAQRLHKPLAAAGREWGAGEQSGVTAQAVGAAGRTLHRACSAYRQPAKPSSPTCKHPHCVERTNQNNLGGETPTQDTHRMPVARSCFSNSSRSSWLQLRPMGLTFSMPLRNSMKVPRLTGMSISGGQRAKGPTGRKVCVCVCERERERERERTPGGQRAAAESGGIKEARVGGCQCLRELTVRHGC